MKMYKSLLAGALVIASGSALAAEKGDFFYHLRAINIEPNESSSVLNVGDLGGLPGTGVGVDNNQTLDISIGYMLTDNIALELLADPSTRHSVSANGLEAYGLPVPGGTEVVKTNVLPPTLFAQYHFDPQGKMDFYVGAGLNYTLFFNTDLTPAAVSVLGASNLDVDNSFGLAGQVGMDFKMKNDWSFNVDVKYINIDTTATFSSALGPVKVDVDINPWVYGIGFGKTF